MKCILIDRATGAMVANLQTNVCERCRYYMKKRIFVREN